jgi:hypothetical protein
VLLKQPQTNHVIWFISTVTPEYTFPIPNRRVAFESICSAHVRSRHPIILSSTAQLCHEVLRSFATLGSLPVDVLGGYLDVTCLAMDTAGRERNEHTAPV